MVKHEPQRLAATARNKNPATRLGVNRRQPIRATHNATAEPFAQPSQTNANERESPITSHGTTGASNGFTNRRDAPALSHDGQMNEPNNSRNCARLVDLPPINARHLAASPTSGIATPSRWAISSITPSSKKSSPDRRARSWSSNRSASTKTHSDASKTTPDSCTINLLTIPPPQNERATTRRTH